eukprot:TRINITY_DN44125_c0_g1_i1.p1 TRINITY_DN44125_c0_g1~~TRINITY_DN44125_c0_g1_i1.p1  ORF type:complete len:203 (+),score=10.14 TRINITY_DN44125_c0_g1_i1:25-609(+)
MSSNLRKASSARAPASIAPSLAVDEIVDGEYEDKDLLPKVPSSTVEGTPPTAATFSRGHVPKDKDEDGELADVEDMYADLAKIRERYGDGVGFEGVNVSPAGSEPLVDTHMKDDFVETIKKTSREEEVPSLKKSASFQRMKEIVKQLAANFQAEEDEGEPSLKKSVSSERLEDLVDNIVRLQECASSEDEWPLV